MNKDLESLGKGIKTLLPPNGYEMHEVERNVVASKIVELVEIYTNKKALKTLDNLQTIRLTDFHNHVIPYNMYCVTTAQLDDFRKRERRKLK